MIGRSRFPVLGCAWVARHLVTGAATLNVDVTDAQVAAYPTLLLPRVQIVDGNIRAKALLGDLGRFGDGGR